MRYENGDRYDGQWKDDLFNGDGEYQWSDGRKYKGEFRDGKHNGHGKMIYIEDDEYLGEWKEDKYMEQAIILTVIGKNMFQCLRTVKSKILRKQIDLNLFDGNLLQQLVS